MKYILIVLASFFVFTSLSAAPEENSLEELKRKIETVLAAAEAAPEAEKRTADAGRLFSLSKEYSDSAFVLQETKKISEKSAQRAFGIILDAEKDFSRALGVLDEYRARLEKIVARGSAAVKWEYSQKLAAVKQHHTSIEVVHELYAIARVTYVKEEGKVLDDSAQKPDKKGLVSAFAVMEKTAEDTAFLARILATEIQENLRDCEKMAVDLEKLAKQ